MIGDLLSTLGTAQKLNIAQIQKAVQDGTLPAYVGIPLLQEKVKERNEATMLLAGQKPKQPKVAEQVMAAADQITAPGEYGPAAPMAAGEMEEGPGIEALSSNLPEEYASGGIIAFADGGESELPEGGYYPEEEEEEEPASKSQFAREFPGIGVLPQRVQRGAVQAGTLTSTPGRLYERALNYFRPQTQEQYEVTKTKLGGPSHAAEMFNKYGLPEEAKPAGPQGMQQRLETMNALPQNKGFTVTRDVKLPGTGGGTGGGRAAIRSLMREEAAPVAAAQAKEDTSIADEITRSRSDRDAMMKMILGDQAKDKEEAEQNKWLALAKAGFQVAGGRSPYAMVNIGEGMSGGIGDIMAAKEHARRAEEAKIGKAADYQAKSQQLEQSLREMGITQQRYKAMEPYYAAQTQEALESANLKRITAGLAPQKLALAAARGAGGGGGAKEPKASMNLQEYKYFTEALPSTLMEDPNMQTGLRGLTDAKPGSKSYNDAQAALKNRIREEVQRRYAMYMQSKPKQTMGERSLELP